MRLNKGKSNLGLPSYMKFGIELEVENLNANAVKKLINDLGWKCVDDTSLGDNGSECVSPVLKETDDNLVWENVAQVCESIKKCPVVKDKSPYVDKCCGGHVHFDAGIFVENPEIMKNFLKLWAESEELVYKMCNKEGEVIRDGAVQTSNPGIIIKNPIRKPESKNIKEYIESARFFNQTIKTFAKSVYNSANAVLVNLMFARGGMASPRGKIIQQQLENGDLKVGKPKSKIYRNLLVKNKLTPERFYGLNLTNIGSENKNTIEFRMSNGTIDPETVKENVFLYASLIKTAVEMTQNPELNSDKVDKFFNKDVSEEEKVGCFLELIMDEQEDRDVYKRRWLSVKDHPIYNKNNNFAKGTFKKTDFAEVALDVKRSSMQNVFDYIAGIKNRVLGKEDKEEYCVGR